MKIKRFTCIRCGAPKLNAYTLPYIICDFCGNFTDVDFTVGMDAWTKDEKRTNTYQHKKIKFENDLERFLNSKDRNSYYQAQLRFWDMYYKVYPEYLPPTVMKEDVYKKFLEICAKSMVEYAFEPDSNLKKLEKKYLALQGKLKYVQKGDKTVAETETFFPFFNQYVKYVEASFKDFYENPEYALFKEILPADLHLKIKMSIFVQAWLPYLSKEDGARMVKQLNFSTEYTEIKNIAGKHIACTGCQKQVFAPSGSFKVNCEQCRTINTVEQTFNCISCSDENPVPEDPAGEVVCLSCQTVNRLIAPLFG